MYTYLHLYLLKKLFQYTLKLISSKSESEVISKHFSFFSDKTFILIFGKI